MIPGICNLEMYQGDTFYLLVEVYDQVLDTQTGEYVQGPVVNLTGATVRAHFRNSVDSTNFVAFTCTVTDPTAGTILVSMSSALTATLSPNGKWDLEVTLNGDVNTYLVGDVTVGREITR